MGRDWPNGLASFCVLQKLDAMDLDYNYSSNDAAAGFRQNITTGVLLAHIAVPQGLLTLIGQHHKLCNQNAVQDSYASAP